MQTQIIPVAKIGKPFGLLGELKLYFLEESVPLYLLDTIFLKHDSTENTWKEMSASEFDISDSKIKFHLFNTPETSCIMTHGIIGALKKDLPYLQEEEFYCSDLIGAKVFNKQGESFGVLKDIINNGANDVFICECDTKQYLIPFIKDFVDPINDTSMIIVTWKKEYSI